MRLHGFSYGFSVDFYRSLFDFVKVGVLDVVILGSLLLLTAGLLVVEWALLLVSTGLGTCTLKESRDSLIQSTKERYLTSDIKYLSISLCYSFFIRIFVELKRITGRFFDPLKMAESIMDLRTHEYKDSRKLEQNKNVIGK